MLQFKGTSYAEALSSLHSLCFKQPWTLQNFYQILNLPNTFGFCNKHCFILCSDLPDDLEILTLAVHPNQRRKGLASMLLKDIQRFAIEHNKNHIFLEVNITNTPAIQLYQKHNFIQTGRRKNYYHDNNKTQDALCFTWVNPNL